MTKRLGVGAGFAVIVLLLALGGVALATRSAGDDFAPFTMRVTYWTATALQREGELPQAGTAVSMLDHRSVDNWKVTVQSSTWDNAAVGTSVQLNGGLHSTFVAQARRLVSRVVPIAEAGRMGPYRWIYPGTFETLTQQGFVPLPTSAGGTASLIEKAATTMTKADGSLGVVSGTTVVFDLATHLPLSVKTFGGGTLRESLDFELLGRP